MYKIIEKLIWIRRLSFQRFFLEILKINILISKIEVRTNGTIEHENSSLLYVCAWCH